MIGSLYVGGAYVSADFQRRGCFAFCRAQMAADPQSQALSPSIPGELDLRCLFLHMLLRRLLAPPAASRSEDSPGRPPAEPPIDRPTEQPASTEVVVNDCPSNDLETTHEGTRTSVDPGAPPQNRERLRSPPPSYSVPAQPLFLPYITQELPCYSEIENTSRGCDYRRLGFLRQSGGHFTPLEIPGYIATDEPRMSSQNPGVRQKNWGGKGEEGEGWDAQGSPTQKSQVS